MILETHKEFDIIFIQELPWSFIRLIPSSLNKERDNLIGAPNHPDWLIFTRSSSNDNDLTRIILYINICLLHFHFSLQKNIFNYRDICCFLFFNNGNIYYMINIYSDISQTVLKYLKNTEANIHNALVMAGNFNIRDSSWDPSFPFHSAYSDLLIDIVDSLDICLSKSTN